MNQNIGGLIIRRKKVEIKNNLVKATQSSNESSSLTTYVTESMTKKYLKSVLGSKKAVDRFVLGVVSAVGANPTLQTCEPKTVLRAALTGEKLGLNPTPQLGEYYIIPYKGMASFVIGYKGLVQLAQKSGEYKKLNCIAIKEGELKDWNPATEEASFEFITNPEVRNKRTSIGYYAFYELKNGFKKAVYWSKGQVEDHAAKWSPSFKTGNSKFWKESFDAMACKTVLRNLLDKWGVKSQQVADAIINDDNDEDSIKENAIEIGDSK
jgi:recombination protein RecT